MRRRRRRRRGPACVCGAPRARARPLCPAQGARARCCCLRCCCCQRLRAKTSHRVEHMSKSKPFCLTFFFFVAERRHTPPLLPRGDVKATLRQPSHQLTRREHAKAPMGFPRREAPAPVCAARGRAGRARAARAEGEARPRRARGRRDRTVCGRRITPLRLSRAQASERRARRSQRYYRLVVALEQTDTSRVACECLAILVCAGPRSRRRVNGMVASRRQGGGRLNGGVASSGSLSLRRMKA